MEDVWIELEKWSGVAVGNGTESGCVGCDSFRVGIAGNEVTFREENGGKIGGPVELVDGAELGLE